MNAAAMRVIIDTDPGIDDAGAILFALHSPVMQVDACPTAFGKLDVEQCPRTALAILGLADRAGIPVHQGSARPLTREPNYAKYIHGDNGLGDIDFGFPSARPASTGAVDALISGIMAAPGEITLIALGPLTNVAVALAVEPRLAHNVRRMILMGGAVLTWGNVTPAASANVYNDPDAARIVYKSGAPLVQVGLDVCRPTVITREHLDRIRKAQTPASRFLLAITPFIQGAYRKRGIHSLGDGGVQFNDVVCMAYVVQPDLFTTRRLPVDIETRGELTAGTTVADFDGRWGRAPNVEVCLGVESRGVADLFAGSMADR